MTAIETTRAPLGPFGQLRLSAVQTWRELVRVLAASAIVTLSAAPAVVTGMTGAPLWLVAVSAVPLALLLTGLARVGADIADGGRARVGAVLAIDPVLALVSLAGASLAVWLCTVPEAQIVGFALAAVWLAIVPRALAYGAVRGRRGLGALRGGAVLAAHRPGATLTLLSLGVLGGFAVVASLGTLALVAPALLATFAARVTADELLAIDQAQGAAR